MTTTHSVGLNATNVVTSHQQPSYRQEARIPDELQAPSATTAKPQ